MAQAHGSPQGGVDQALATWRDRLAAASRNVAELSELPAYLTLKAATRGDAAQASQEARTLVATVEELWQSVLLLGEALSRAEAARAAATRMWMGFGGGPAATVADILEGRSIGIKLGESPVLHRGLLGETAETVWVSPAELLSTMQAAFDSARATLSRYSAAGDRIVTLRRGLVARIAALPAGDAAPFVARLEACRGADPLRLVEQLEALNGEVERACDAADAARRARAEAEHGLREGRALLGVIEAAQQRAHSANEAAAACIRYDALPGPVEPTRELPAWLDRLDRVFADGRIAACTAGVGQLAGAGGANPGWLAGGCGSGGASSRTAG